MTRPTIGELLDGVAAGLRASVLPEIAAGPARRQLQMAIAIIRRVAAACDRIGPYLYADNKDIEQTLRRACAALGIDEIEGMDAGLGAMRQAILDALDELDTAGVEYPSSALLMERNVKLQALLSELQEALFTRPPGAARKTLTDLRAAEVSAMLRELLRRMVAREMEVNKAPHAG